MQINKRIATAGVVGVLLVALCLTREPLLRPNRTTIKMWLGGSAIMLERGKDAQHFVFDKIDSDKLQNIEHVDGAIYRTTFWPDPSEATVTYKFQYPYQGTFQSYRANISYTWVLGFFEVRRQKRSVVIVGPVDNN